MRCLSFTPSKLQLAAWRTQAYLTFEVRVILLTLCQYHGTYVLKCREDSSRGSESWGELQQPQGRETTIPSCPLSRAPATSAALCSVCHVVYSR